MTFPKFIRLAVLSALSFHHLHAPKTTISLLSQSRPTNTVRAEDSFSFAAWAKKCPELFTEQIAGIVMDFTLVKLNGGLMHDRKTEHL